MPVVDANPEHEVVYQELTDLVSRHAPRITALEVLAIAANMVGKLVAMQDQRKITPNEAMAVVARNVEHGNRQVVDQLRREAGRSTKQ